MYALRHYYIFLEYVGRSTWKTDTQTAIKIKNKVERGGRGYWGSLLHVKVENNCTNTSMIKVVKVHSLSGRAIALWLLALKMQMDRLWVSQTLPPNPAKIR